MTTLFLVRLRKTLSILQRLSLAVIAGLSMQIAWAAEPIQEQGPVVGEVSLVLGKAFLQTVDAKRLPIRVGTQIHETDQILTQANGHVHVRFVDQALVSVRPDSTLEILRYDYNPDQPDRSSVKFNLVEGVTRSISGDAARSARQRFRLNTPIAAIGVRGTDFVVSATDQTVRALVNEGAIVMAPYSADCTADAFGPCATNAVELSQNTLQIIELDGSTPLPRLIPAADTRNQGSLQQQVQLALDTSSDADDKTVGTDVYLENVTSNKVTADAANANQPAPVALPDFTPKTAVSAAVLNQKQLVWGRWADGEGNLERLTVPHLDARSAREVTVGNSDYVLVRTENGSKQIDQTLGVVSFSLSSAQAFYSPANGNTVAMQVRGGNLDIDFVKNNFATDLNLSHAATGNVSISGAGRISEAGYFNSIETGQRIAGSVSIDGSEAGYFFEKQLLDGGIQGLTLWDSK